MAPSGSDSFSSSTRWSPLRTASKRNAPLRASSDREPPSSVSTAPSRPASLGIRLAVPIGVLDDASAYAAERHQRERDAAGFTARQLQDEVRRRRRIEVHRQRLHVEADVQCARRNVQEAELTVARSGHVRRGSEANGNARQGVFAGIGQPIAVPVGEHAAEDGSAATRRPCRPTPRWRRATSPVEMVWTTRNVDRVSQPFSVGQQAGGRAIEIDVEADRGLRGQLAVQAAAQRVARREEIGESIAIAGGGALQAEPQAAIEDLLLSAAGELEKRAAAAALQILLRDRRDAEELACGAIRSGRTDPTCRAACSSSRRRGDRRSRAGRTVRTR